MLSSMATTIEMSALTLVKPGTSHKGFGDAVWLAIGLLWSEAPVHPSAAHPRSFTIRTEILTIRAMER